MHSVWGIIIIFLKLYVVFTGTVAVVMGGDQYHWGKNAASLEIFVWNHKQKSAHKQEARWSALFG